MSVRRRFGKPEKQQHSDLGPCCVCERSGPSVRNIIMLVQRAPVPGTGWGCAVCHLPADGACAIVCDTCLLGFDVLKLRFVISGYPTKKQRVPYDSLSPEPFDHDLRYHPEEQEP